MKENIGDNTKRSGLSDTVIIRWKWDNEKKYRDFLKLRHGGNTETQYDLDLKYKEDPFEKESVLIHLEQLNEDSPALKKSKIKNLLLSEDWLWNPDQNVDFDKEVDKLMDEI